MCIGKVLSQDTNVVISFDFNNHDFSEKNNQLKVTPVGLTFSEDRFGNERSAIYIHGHNSSYLNLGTSNLLKPKRGTVALWVNLERVVRAGKGYPNNPLIVAKNSGNGNEDFYIAYTMAYEIYSNRFGAAMTRDSLKGVVAYSNIKLDLNKWYHIAITFNDQLFSFYVNGELQGAFKKGFETNYQEGDSVMVGNAANVKNERYSQGVFDDIFIFHRPLSEGEVKDLYNAGNPNRGSNFLMYALSSVGVILIITFISFFLVRKKRIGLKKQSEQYVLLSKMNELEMKAAKSQMNPHFMFNALNSIQQFVIARENEKARIYLSRFSKLLRKLLETNKNDKISLHEEFEILKGYIEIEALRFNNVFSYQISVDEKIKTSETFLPHMMIQPFVENAIWHGLLLKEGEKMLSVEFKLLNEATLECNVEDNGVGRNTAGKSQPADDHNTSLATGLIIQRLNLMSELNKSVYSLQINDKKAADGKSEGTKIVLTLPVK